MNKKIVVTGGAGFIGSHVVRALLTEDARVVAFDSLVSGARENIPPEAELIVGDIRDADALLQAFKGADAVVHLAARVSVPESIEHPEATHDVNVSGTERIFETASKSGVCRLVYASSAAVYGSLPELPKTESSALAPQSPYAESKLENERTAARFTDRGFSNLGLRFFNVYGLGQRADHAYASVIPKLIACAREGKPLPISGDGSQTRDFIHVRDVARAIALALRAAAEGVCNIGSGHETPLTDLVSLIREKYPVSIEHLPPRPGDILRSVADISRAKQVLGWSPTTTLADGVRELLA
jgi:UDP-glucose 4-epimerase